MRALHLPTDPKRSQLLEVLKDTRLGLPFVEPRNFLELRRKGLARALPLTQ